MRAGIPVSGIDTVLVSHTHADHIGGLLQLAQTWYIGNWEGYTPPGYHPRILVPEEALEGMWNLMRLGYMVPDNIKPLELGFVPVNPGPGVSRVHESEGIVVEAMLNGHLQGFLRKVPDVAGRFPDRKGQSLSYAIGVGGNRVVYSGDLASLEELHPLLAEPTDLLIVELAHFGLDALAGFLGNVSKMVANILVTHIGPRYDKDDKAIIETLAHAGIPGIWVASDGMRIGLG